MCCATNKPFLDDKKSGTVLPNFMFWSFAHLCSPLHWESFDDESPLRPLYSPTYLLPYKTLSRYSKNNGRKILNRSSWVFCNFRFLMQSPCEGIKEARVLDTSLQKLREDC